MANTKPLRILHFADAHIDIANYGRHDPQTALPIRVMDFLKALDQVIDAALAEPVDLVLFAGDAYKDRNPQPTFQREWGQRLMKLSKASIPTLLLVGNHDVAPASGRAHTLQEFDTLAVPNIHVADRIRCWRPEELGLPLQIITVPWLSPSRLMTREEMSGKSRQEVWQTLEEIVADRIETLVGAADPSLPLILTAHASVQGAKYGSERAVILGHELVLSGRVVNDKRLDYVALGHIHKHQALTSKGSRPPIVYPGSIERIDFGEAREHKGFILAEVGKGYADWEFVRLQTRPFIDLKIETPAAETFMEDVLRQLPLPDEVTGAICRVQLNYPRDWEPLLDERLILERFDGALSIQIQKHRLAEKRARLGDAADTNSLTPEQLLDMYWDTIGLDPEEAEAMRDLAKEVLATVDDE